MDGDDVRVGLAITVARAAGGDQRSLADFYDATAPAAHELALLLTGDRDTAERLVLEGYRCALRRAGEVATSSWSTRAWFLGIVRERWQDRT